MSKMSQANEFDQKHENLELVTRNYLKILKRFRKKEELNKFMKFWAHDYDNYIIKEDQTEEPGNYQSINLQRKKRKSLPCPYEDEKKSFNLYPVLEKQQIQKNLLKKHLKQKQLCIDRRKDDEKENLIKINVLKREQKLPLMTKRNQKVQSLKEQFFKKNTIRKDYENQLFIKIKQISTSNLKVLQKKKKKKTLVKIESIPKQKSKQLILKKKDKLQKNNEERPPLQNKYFEETNRVTGWRQINQFQFGEQNQIFGIDQNT